MDVFKINLDLPPKMRFAEPTRKYKKEIMQILEIYENLLINGRGVPESFKVSLDQGLYLNYRERYLEFEGIAQVLGIPTSRLITANYAYEFVAFCTSIIFKDKSGTISHMRILDFIAPEI